MWPSNDLLSSLILRLNARKNAGTGEAVMKKFAIIGALTPPRTDVVAIVCGTLCSVAAALPAQSADLSAYPYEYSAYGTGYGGYGGYGGYYHGCSSCGCRPCCNSCGHRAFIQPGPVVERHWDYWERRYPAPYPYHYPNYYPSGYAGYPYYPSSYAGYPSYPYPNDYAYGGGPRPRLGFGGIQYPPAPISYEREAPPPSYEYQAAAPYDYRAATPTAYDYQGAPRPGYDFPSPRPPAGIGGAYSNASYLE
jgi:hypothetical protein